MAQPKPLRRDPLPTGRPSSPAELIALAQTLATRTPLWEPMVEFHDDRRWYTRIAGGEGWEAWLHTWLPGHRTGEHHHGRSAAALIVLTGAIEETKTLNGIVSRTVLLPGVATTLPPGQSHDLSWSAAEPSISLHVYSPPLTKPLTPRP